MTDLFTDLVAQDARVMRAARMLPTEGTLTPEQRRAGHKTIRSFLDEHHLTDTDFRRGIREKSAAAVSWFFNNDPRLKLAKRDEFIRKGMAWVELEIRAIQSRQQFPVGYYETKVAKAAFGGTRKLSERADGGLFWGPSGIGKTVIAKAIAAELPNAVLVTVRPDSRRTTGFLRAVHAAMRGRRKRGGTVYFSDVVELFKQSERVSSRPVLIVDQAHLLHESVYQVLMDLLDEAGVSFALFGTIDLHRHVAKDEDPVFYGQLSSRIGLRMDLTPELMGAGRSRRRPVFTVSDVRGIFQSGKVKLHADAAKLLVDIANNSDGHLRRVDRLVAWATAIARKRCNAEAVTILPADVFQASRIVEGEDRARTLPPAAGAAAQVVEATA